NHTQSLFASDRWSGKFSYARFSMSFLRGGRCMTPRMLYGVVLGVVVGVAFGIGLYTFAYAKGWSYLSDNPAACANCHVMREQFDGWLKSSHRAVATCNSCHTPANFIGKYATKASNGFWHSFFFTTGGYEDNIQIKP